MLHKRIGKRQGFIIKHGCKKYCGFLVDPNLLLMHTININEKQAAYISKKILLGNEKSAQLFQAVSNSSILDEIFYFLLSYML